MAEKKGLNYRQRAFIEAYLRTGNATKSAIEAGYSATSAHNQGHRLINNDEVIEVIRARVEAFEVKTDLILARMIDRATGSMAMLSDVDSNGDLKLNFDKAQKLGAMHLIKKIKQTDEKKSFGEDNEIERTTVEVELYDAQAADVQLGRFLKLWTDKIEIADPRQALLRDIIAGTIDYESLESEFGSKFAVEAFRDAGISIPSEAGTGAPEDID